MVCKELLLYLSLISLYDFALMKVQSLPVISSPSPTTVRPGNNSKPRPFYDVDADPLTSHDVEDWTVVLGEHHLNKKQDAFEQRRNVVNITTHEDYLSMWFEGIYDTPPKNDVALLKLSKPLVFNNYVQPLCLPRTHDKFSPNEECYVAGWGHTQWNGTQPDILREAKVKLVSREVCNQEKSYNGTIHDTAMCAGFPSGGIDACEYDSGGALVCPRDGRFYAAGLVSWGDECARPHKYGVYADLTALTPWVIKKIRQFEIDAASRTSALRG